MQIAQLGAPYALRHTIALVAHSGGYFARARQSQVALRDRLPVSLRPRLAAFAAADYMGMAEVSRRAHGAEPCRRQKSVFEGGCVRCLPAEFAEPVVVDAEVVGDLVGDGAADLVPESASRYGTSYSTNDSNSKQPSCCNEAVSEPLVGPFRPKCCLLAECDHRYQQI